MPEVVRVLFLVELVAPFVLTSWREETTMLWISDLHLLLPFYLSMVKHRWGQMTMLAVTHHPTEGRRPAERACDMDQSGELDPGGVHDTGRSGEEDPG